MKRCLHAWQPRWSVNLKAAQRLALRILADNSAPELLERAQGTGARRPRRRSDAPARGRRAARATTDARLTAIADSLLKGQLVAGEGLLGAVLSKPVGQNSWTPKMCWVYSNPLSRTSFVATKCSCTHSSSRADEIELQEIVLWAASNTLEESPAPRARMTAPQNGAAKSFSMRSPDCHSQHCSNSTTRIWR